MDVATDPEQVKVWISTIEPHSRRLTGAVFQNDSAVEVLDNPRVSVISDDMVVEGDCVVIGTVVGEDKQLVPIAAVSAGQAVYLNETDWSDGLWFVRVGQASSPQEAFRLAIADMNGRTGARWPRAVQDSVSFLREDEPHWPADRRAG